MPQSDLGPLRDRHHRPSGRRCEKVPRSYGDAAGNMRIDVTGPTELALALETSSADTNMDAFAVMVLQTLLKIVCG